MNKINYRSRYDKFIKKAKKRILIGFHEKHHIIPKCMGGSNDSINIVKLTSKEHYWAHYLLTKIYPTNTKLAYAFYMMCTEKSDYRPKASYKLVQASKKSWKRLKKQR